MVNAPNSIFDWNWCEWRRSISLAIVKPALIFLITLIGLPVAAIGRSAVLTAGGAWVAIDRGSQCEALSRSQNVASKDKIQAMAGFSFAPDHRIWGQFHARLSRTPRSGATVMTVIGDQPFLLVTRGGWAWSRAPAQALTIIAAARQATTMRLESRDESGRRFSDPYLLDGAPTAIDSAAARCALRSAGKIR
jgi:hypothetical protein